MTAASCNILGYFPEEYEIEVDESVVPVKNRPRRIPHAKKAAVEAKLEELERAGIIAQVVCQLRGSAI